MALTRIKTDQITDGAITGDDVNPTFDLSGKSLGNLTSTGIDDNSVSVVITLDSSNRMGVGVTSPTEKIDVNGNVKAISFLGNASTASAWATSRTITLSGDLSGSVILDGSANVTLTATVADDSHNHIISNVDGLQTALNAKLDSSSYTAADVLTKIKTVDGSGSGLDADTLDGINSSSFLRSDTATTFSGDVLRVNTLAGALGSNTGQVNTLQIFQPTLNTDAFQTFHIGNDFAVHFGLDGTTNDLFVGGWSKGANKYKIWHAGNDGSGSGLDADLLDGNHASAFPLLTSSPTFTGGGLTVSSGNGVVSIGTDAGGSISLGKVDGVSSSPYIDFNTSTTAVDNNVRIQASGSSAGAGAGTLAITAGTVFTTKPSGAAWALYSKTNGISNESGIYSDASNNMQFAARDGSGALRVVIDSNSSGLSYINAGNFGVGTTAPVQKLDVNGTVNIGDGNNRLNISANSSGALIKNVDNSSLSLWTNNTQYVTLTTGGNLGVGTTTPGHAIEANGYVASKKSTGAMTRFILQNSNRFWSLSNYGTDYTPNGSFHIADETAGTVRFSINSTGNVGVGVSDPTQKFQVAGPLSSTASTTEYHTSTSFQYKYSASEHIAQYKKESNTYAYYWRTSVDGLPNASFKNIAEWYNNRLSFYVDNTEQMRLDTIGLGIGTSFPAYKLHVNGTATVGSFLRSDGLIFNSRGDEEPSLTQRNHGLAEFFATGTSTASYAAVYPGTEIFEKNPATGEFTSIVASSTTPSRGSISVTSGKLYYASKPIHIMGDVDRNDLLIPTSLSGKYFYHHSNRNQPHFFTFYAPYGAAKITYYDNSNTNGINGTPTQTVNVDVGSSVTITATVEGDHYFKIEGSPVVGSVWSVAGDKLIMTPCSRIVYMRRGAQAKTIYGSSVSSSDGTGLFGWGVVYYNESEPLNAVSIADASGGDCETAVPLNMLSDTFSWGQALSDFVITAPYPNTFVRVSYYNGSSWVVWDDISLNGDILSPASAGRDGTNGPGVDGSNFSGTAADMASGANLWLFSSNNPISVVINDPGDDELQLFGWSSQDVYINNRSAASGFALLSGATFTGDVSAPNFNSTSDIKFKTDVQTVSDAINKVNNLRGVTFKWIETNKPSIGVIAQEVENVIPEVVSTNDDGDKSVNYDAMVGLLIEAIKEQQAEIEKLKSIIGNK